MDRNTPVTVRLHSPMPQRAGLKPGSGALKLMLELVQPGETLLAALSRLAEIHGAGLAQVLFDQETGKLKSSFALAVNGQVVNHGASQEQPLSPGDEIALLPAFAGG